MCKTVEVYLYRASVKVFGGCTTSVKKDLTSQCQMLSTVLCTFLLPLSLLMDILSVLFRLTAEPSTSVIFLALCWLLMTLFHQLSVRLLAISNDNSDPKAAISTVCSLFPGFTP